MIWASHRYTWGLTDGRDACQTPRALAELSQDRINSLRGACVSVSEFKSQLDELMDRAGVAPTEEGLTQSVGSPIREWTANLVSSGEAPVLMDAEWGYARVFKLPEELGEQAYAMISGYAMNGYWIDGLLMDGVLSVTSTGRGLGKGTGLIAACILDTGSLPEGSSEGDRMSADRAAGVAEAIACPERGCGIDFGL